MNQDRQRWCLGVGLLILLLATAQAAPPEDNQTQPQVTERMRQLNEHLGAGRFEQAVQVAEQVLALRQKSQGEKHWQTVDARLDVERFRRLAKVPAKDRASVVRVLGLFGKGQELGRPGRYREAEKLLVEGLALSRRVLGEEDPETAQGYNELANNLELQGRYSQAQPLFEKALAIWRRSLGEDHAYTAIGYSNLAHIRNSQGDAAEAESLNQKALAIRRKALGEEHPETAVSYHNLAYTLDSQGKHGKAQPLLEKALAIRRKVLGELHSDTADSYDGVGTNLSAQGKYAQAYTYSQKSLLIRRKVLGLNHPDTAMSYSNLGYNLNRLGKAAEAQPLYEQALAIFRQVMGEDHPYTARSYNNLAGNLNAQGKVVQAVVLYEKALTIRKRALGEDHPSTASSYDNLASCLSAQGKHAEAHPLLEKALLIRRKVLGEEHPDTALSYNNVAANLDRQGKYEQSYPLLQKMLAIHRKTLGEMHPETAASYNSIAASLSSQRKYAQAQPMLEKALEIKRQVLGEKHPDTATSYNNVGMNLHEQGEYARAQPLLEMALQIDRELLGDDHPRTVVTCNNVALNLWRRGRHRQAVRLWQASLPAQEAARLHRAASGFERAIASRWHFHPRAALAVGLAALGQPENAFRHAEANLARGLLDDLSSASTQPAVQVRELHNRLEHLSQQLLPLLVRSELSAEQQDHRDELIRDRRRILSQLAQLAADASVGEVLPRHRLQKQIPADAAFVFWVDVDALNEHWACILRQDGAPVWQRLTGTGKAGVWTDSDIDLPGRLYRALMNSDSDSSERQRLIDTLRKQRLEPLLPHLRAQGKLPAVRRLLVVPVGWAGHVPIEVLTSEFNVSYVPSGSVFARLGEKHRPVKLSPLLALGDPVFTPPTAHLPEPPTHGILLRLVLPGGNAARAGLRAGDVLLSVGSQRLESLDDLKKALSGREVAATFWRDGKQGKARLAGGSLGVVVDQRSARVAVSEWRKGESSAVLRGTGHKPLPGTRLEVEAIGRLLDEGLTTRLLGSDASEQELDRLKAEGKLKRYRLVHLATHGEVDWERPGRSALILAHDRLPHPLEQARQGKKVYDGRLTVSTIRNTWSLDADLVVLSACQTGLGQEAGGEGLLGFAQAFLHKGARSVVLSRWKVDDTATALLMLRFYENLIGKRSKEKIKPLSRVAALEEAKRWLRTMSRKQAEELAVRHAGGTLRATEGDDRPLIKDKPARVPASDRPFEHPFYWAAFVLVGDPD